MFTLFCFIWSLPCVVLLVCIILSQTFVQLVRPILFLSLKLFSWSELYLPSQSCLLPLYITLPSALQLTKYAVLYFARITFWHLSVIIFASDIFLHEITSTCPLRLFSQLHSSAYESTEKLSGSPFLHRNYHISDMHWSYFLLVCFCLWFYRLWWGWNCLAQNVVQCRSWIKYVNRKIKLCLHLLKKYFKNI